MDSKSTTSDGVRVQVPWLVPIFINLVLNFIKDFYFYLDTSKVKIVKKDYSILGGDKMKGIDVSSYQGNINWNLVKNNIDFAIIRCGYGDNIESQDDKQFMNNVSGCINNNIPFAIYLYSYAKNLKGEESIQSEIEHCIRLLSKISMKPFCVYLDMEDDSTRYLGKDTLTSYAEYFSNQITNLGYKSGIYANEYWFNTYLDINKIKNNNSSIWCAKYSNNRPSISSNYDIWQYSSTGTIEGIIGNVDLNTMTNNIISSDINPNINNKKVNVYYKVKTKKYNWLPEVKNLDDYAGWHNDPITAIAIKTDIGKIKYRIHIKNSGWLPYVTGYNINDINNGYAGDGRNIIDLVEVYYYTPENIRPYKKAKYKINNYSWQYDNEKTNNQDGYAGVLGVPATKFQITIE